MNRELIDAMAQHRFRLLAVLVAFLAVAGLLVRAAVAHGIGLESAFYFAGAIVSLLLFCRQLLISLENERVSRRLDEAHRHSVAGQERTRQLNDDLKTTQDKLKANNEALAAANKRLRAMATSDPQTGMLNHRATLAAIDNELSRARRYERDDLWL